MIFMKRRNTSLYWKGLVQGKKSLSNRRGVNYKKGPKTKVKKWAEEEFLFCPGFSINSL